MRRIVVKNEFEKWLIKNRAWSSANPHGWVVPVAALGQWALGDYQAGADKVRYSKEIAVGCLGRHNFDLFLKMEKKRRLKYGKEEIK